MKKKLFYFLIVLFLNLGISNTIFGQRDSISWEDNGHLLDRLYRLELKTRRKLNAQPKYISDTLLFTSRMFRERSMGDQRISAKYFTWLAQLNTYKNLEVYDRDSAQLRGVYQCDSIYFTSHYKFSSINNFYGKYYKLTDKTQFESFILQNKMPVLVTEVRKVKMRKWKIKMYLLK